ncbi:MAG: conjugal transfer protein TraG N-terminal domain-containing protein [Deltaproteobacteria bacterium]|nr:conjugal transfer protein TraG N-terminal domain-containing protein [Deltaproteobacteria bacterium]
MSLDTSQIGSVSNIIAATLETSGQYLQSEILKHLDTDGLAYSLGALCYLLSALIAFVTYAMGGDYKFFRWFLIGPALFYVAILNTEDSTGAAWQFGSKKRDSAYVEKYTKGVTYNSDSQGSQAATSMKVSTMFAEWNRFTSGVIQATIDALGVVKKDGDVHFLNQVKKYEGLFKATITDENLKQLVNLATINNCSSYYTLARTLNNLGVTNPERAEIEEKMKKAGNLVALTADDSRAPLLKWLKTDGISDIAAKTLGDKVETDGSIKKDSPLTCLDTWKLSFAILQAHATETLDAVLSMDNANDSSEAAKDMRKKARERLLMKFDMEVRTDDDKIKTQGLSNDQKLQALLNEVAMNMFVKELGQVNPTIVQMNYIPTALESKDVTRTEGASGSRVPEASKYNNPDIARSMRLFGSFDHWYRKGDFLAVAQTLPYIQGLLLYFLAAAFPFVAFMFLVPGRHHVVFSWMSLWFWVKSWDLGMAFVMMIDDILYAFMPHGAPMTTELLNVQQGPAEALKRAMEVDPSYSVATYYNLIAACIVTMPAIMALIVKKGGSEILDAVSNGVSNFAGNVGTTIGRYMTSTKLQENKALFEKRIWQATENNFYNAYLQPNVAKAIGGEKLLSLSSQYMKAASDKAVDSVALGEIANAYTKEMNSIFSGLTAAEAAQKKELVGAEVEKNLHFAMLNEANSLRNIQLAQDMNMLGWNSHDLVAAIDHEKFIAPLKAQTDFNYAEKVQDSIITVIPALGAQLAEPSEKLPMQGPSTAEIPTEGEMGRSRGRGY